MATRGRIQYQADGEHLIKGAKTFDIHPDLLEKIEEAGGGAIETVKVNGVTQPITNKTVNITVPVVEDSLGSYSTTNALSANQGRVLYDAIQHLESIGRFLSLWNAETGLPMDNPQLNPYPYNTGDYYIVSRVGSRNYRPSGAQYVAGQASTEEETETVKVDDFYFYNGTNWFHLSNEGPSLAIDTALSLTSTNAVENRVITAALNNKADRNDLDNYYTKTEVDDKIEAELQDAVKDGTLTIQKNGTDQGTFSANQATNKTINITMNKIDVGLENVDNTSDLNKPISTATQAALDLKADKTELDDYYKKTETYNKTEVDALLDDKADKSTTYTKTEVDAFLDDKADKSTTYTKTEVDTLLDDKQDKLTSGNGISIANKVISNTGVLTVNGEDGDVVVNDVKKKATSPSSPTQGTVWYDTTNDILKTYDGTDWNEVGAGNGDMLYEDFEFATKTGNAITLSISSKVVNPTTNFTINAPSTIKDGITYVLRVQNGATPPTMTLGTNITNPYNVDLSLSASKTDTFAFLAVDNKLELQPTEADISDNVYTKTEVDALLDDKQDVLTAGDNIEIDSTTNEISATNNASYFKTQPEYDALPTTKTSDGNLYVIIDTRLNLMPFEELLALETDTAILNELNSHAEDYAEVYCADGDIVLQEKPSSQLPRQDAYLKTYMFAGTWNGGNKICIYGYYDTNLTNQELTAMGLPADQIEKILSGEWNILGYFPPEPGPQ